MIHRRPDGSPYDPSGFNVKQFEEQYGPGGVPEGWTAPGSAISPIQNPNGILVLGGFMLFLSGVFVLVGITTFNSGDTKLFIVSIILTLFSLGFVVWSFVISQRRRKWLRENSTTTK